MIEIYFIPVLEAADWISLVISSYVALIVLCTDSMQRVANLHDAIIIFAQQIWWGYQSDPVVTPCRDEEVRNSTYCIAL